MVSLPRTSRYSALALAATLAAVLVLAPVHSMDSSTTRLIASTPPLPRDVYFSDYTANGSVSRIMRAELSTRLSSQLLSSSESSFPEVEVSPDGRYLAYLELPAGQHNATAHVIDLTQDEAARVVPLQAGAGVSGLLWKSSDVLTYSQMGSGFGDVYTWDLASASAERIADSRQYPLQPDWPCDVAPVQLAASDWSGDGEQLLLTAYSDCYEVVFADAVLLRDGVLSEIVDVGERTSQPTWVSGDQQIVVEGVDGVYSADATGSSVQIVAEDATGASALTQQSDVAYIASEVSAAGGRSAELEVVEDEGARPEDVDHGAGTPGHVQWLPDGNGLLVVAETDFGMELAVTSQDASANSLAQAQAIFDVSIAGGSNG